MSLYNNKWVNASLFMDRRFRLTILKVYRRDCLSFLKMEQWRKSCLVDSIAFPQLQIWFSESQKLWRNICSRKWFKPTCSLVRWLKPKELGTLKIMLGWGLINSRIRFLKSLSEGEQRIFESKLFHSMMLDGKKVF